MDYFIYYDVFNSRMIPVEYDGNTVFNNPNWSHFYNEEDSDFVLMNKLFSIPSNMKGSKIAILNFLSSVTKRSWFSTIPKIIFISSITSPSKLIIFFKFANFKIDQSDKALFKISSKHKVQPGVPAWARFATTGLALAAFPEFDWNHQNNSLYISGESYAGIYAPYLTW